MKDLYDEIMEAIEDPFATLKESSTAEFKDLPDGLNLEDLDRVHVGLLCEILSEEE